MPAIDQSPPPESSGGVDGTSPGLDRARSDLECVSRVWDASTRVRQTAPIQGWLDSSIVLETLVQPRVAGNPHTNWLIGLVTRLGIPRGGRWLSLGCGAAGLEMHAAQQGLFASLRGLDLSLASIEEARRAASSAKPVAMEFGVVDFNVLELPPDSYDVVLANMSLHHVRELPRVLDQVAASLTGQGLLILNEYVGPRQFQFTDRQVSIVTELLHALPPSLRTDLATRQVKEEYVRMPVEHWNAVDPSEAIRSDQILSEVGQRFDIVERCDYGGTILHLLLEHIAHNFDPRDGKDVAIISLLVQFEDLLIRYGVLDSDFTALAARPKKAGAPETTLRKEARTGSAPVENADERIRRLEGALAVSRERLAAIENSKGWKAVQFLRHLVGREW